MECREVRQLAEAFVSEQLLVETTQAVVAHLERCPACRAEIDGLRRLRTATRSAFEHAPDLAVRADFAAALTSRLQQTEQARRRPARTFRRQWLAIAASALLVVGAGLGWREWTLSRTLALLHAAVGDHRFCALVYKLTESPIPLTEAARRYGPVNGRLDTVEPSTTSLSGGTLQILERHSCVFEGRRFAHIVLRYKGAAVSLLVTDERRSMLAMTDAGVSAMPATDGFHVASFHGPRHAVFLVSSLNDDDLQEVARAMAGPVSRALAGA